MDVIYRTAQPGMSGYVRRLFLLSAGVYLISKGLVAVQGDGQLISPIWPAAGVALAGILIWGPGMWPAIYLPMGLSSLVAGDAILFSIFAPAGLTASIWLACRILDRLKFDRTLSASRDVTMLIVAGAILPMAGAGLWNVTLLVLTEEVAHVSFVQIATIYGIAYATGIVVVTPLILLAADQRRPSKHWKDWILFGVLMVSVAVAFSLPGHDTVLAYLPFPFLVWLALRGGLPMAVLGILGSVAGAVAFTSYGVGPFGGGTPLANFAQIEVYIGIFATTGMLLGSGAEAQQREKVLREHAATREAELERIKAQIHPHFLFNCLAAIHSLAGTDTESARSGIIALSDLLRASLDSAGEKYIPLGVEIKMIENYLALQQMRFEDSLQISVECDSEAAVALIPPMLVQPLVENAIKHGVDDGGCVTVEVRAYTDKEGLKILVKNTASAGDPKNWIAGIGLSSVRRRIESTWNDQATLTISRENPNWIVACIRITKELK